MTNAPDFPPSQFSLGDALEATSDWDEQDAAGLSEDDTEYDDVAIGYDDEADPEALTLGAQELAERHALRRVAGLRTELEDITEVEYRQLRLEKVVLVGVWTEGTAQDAENSMSELALLAETAGSQVLEAVFQRRHRPDPATYIGRGKVEAIREIVQATGADTVICDGDLAPSQLRNLEDRIKVKVVDRTALILDIFAQHAKSKEGQAQVELAQLQYQKQRLRGWGGSLSRQAGGRVGGAGGTGGGIGSRGPGETKIETDRRRINTRIAKLRRELKAMVAHERHPRHQAPFAPGKQDPERGDRWLHQCWQVLAAQSNDQRAGAGRGLPLRDPGSDHSSYDDDRRAGLHDVGHRRFRPTPAFRSTLEEVADADLLLHVVDGSHPDPEGQIAAVREVLHDIDAGKVPEIIVINKADAADPIAIDRVRRREPHSVVVSARTGLGIEALLAMVETELPRPQVEFDVLLPYDRGDLVNRIHQQAEIASLEHTADGTRVVGRAHGDLATDLAAYSR